MSAHTEPELQESPSASRKRKHSATDTGTERVIKHRSSQACQSCRTRKVRCDVVSNGSRCTNCRLDNVDCVVVPSRRGKTNNRVASQSSTDVTKSLPSQMAQVRRDSSPEVAKTDDWGYETVYSPTSPSVAGHVPACVTFDEDSDKMRGDQQSVDNDAIRNGTDGPSSQPYGGLLTPETVTNNLNQYQLPSFITPFSGRIMSEDLNFLVQKGATTMPEHHLRMEIIQAYLFSVHPFMPMLDFKAFIRAVMTNQGEDRISLLLFQAVMFAGVHSLPLHVVQRFGFKSVKQARKVFFDRVRLLYEFDVETDSAAVLQACVLMSLWYGKWDDRRHTWHWTGLAYDVARNMGLQREPTTRYASDKVRRFRRRLWWSLYIRDRMIALGTRRPMRIRDEDFDVTMLTLEDFDLDPMEESDQGRSLIPSKEENTSTALMCIQLAKLCVCIGHVVSSQYTVLSNQQDVPPTMMMVSRRNGGHFQELESCDRELDDWFQALNKNVRRTSSATVQLGPQSCSEVHWAILNLTYLTVVNVLHRAQALQPPSEAAEAQPVQISSRSKVKEAARGLTKVAQSMLHQDQVRYLGPIGVTALVAACLSHMLDVSSGDADVHDASTFRLYQTLQVLQSLTGIWPSADAAVSFLTSITKKAGIPIPLQVAAPAGDFVESVVEPLARPSIERKQKMDRKSSTSSPSGRLNMLNEQPDALSASHRVIPFQNLTPSTDSHVQQQVLLDRDEQFQSPNGAMPSGARSLTIDPSAMAIAGSKPTLMSNHGSADMNKDVFNTEIRNNQYIDASFGGPSKQAAEGTTYDWNNNMDAGMDLESIAFNYDFYSNAFGLFDGDVQYM